MKAIEAIKIAYKQFSVVKKHVNYKITNSML